MTVSANSFGLAFFAWDRERSVACDQRGQACPAGTKSTGINFPLPRVYASQFDYFRLRLKPLDAMTWPGMKPCGYGSTGTSRG